MVPHYSNLGICFRSFHNDDNDDDDDAKIQSTNFFVCFLVNTKLGRFVVEHFVILFSFQNFFMFILLSLLYFGF